MRLINLSKKGEAYVVRAQKVFKLLGLSIGSSFVEFKKEEGDNNWYTSNGSVVDDRRSIILDKWLKDHRRFIE